MPDFDIVGIGPMNIDNLYRTRVNLIEGESIVEGLGQFPGGSSANTIYGLARLGLNTGFIGIVGADTEGIKLVEDLSAVGVDTSHVGRKEGVPTGNVLCLNDRAGKRALYVFPGANNELSFDNINLEYIKQAKRLHVSAFSGEEQYDLLVRTLGSIGREIQVSLAPGSIYSARSLKLLAPLLEKTRLLFINQIEIEQLTGTTYIKGARECIKRGCAVVIVTFGSGYAVTPRKTITAYVRDENNEWEVEPVALPWQPQAETTGAGDAFSAGYIFGDSIGKKPGECAVLGDLVARMCITRTGARAGLPTRSELGERYLSFLGKTL